ncbi:uncharacterized protein LOC133287200 [Gastrolobium bilobum]|uniref:uncharacterized protein LOC133287200 n=1 Tax=Gastrolobium bilobum TaxID=150636 RepID=UPI002AB02C1E|nr:uncharacterized protein LOC133287200 [Gastrolobium bilobum]
MYVTRPLSMYKRNPRALSEPPPAGPNSGYLVIFDEEAHTYSCFGLCKHDSITDLPFPQNKNLTIDESNDEGSMFVPVLNQPLSSNRYYVIKSWGKHEGQASTSSCPKGIFKDTSKFYIEDAKPRPLDPFDDYQQFEIIKKNYGFQAKSAAPDGIPPRLLREKDWTFAAPTPSNYILDEALGVNESLRSRLPDFNFSLYNDRSDSVVAGKWYCPFMFVKERMKLKDQMRMSAFYVLTLEQRWEKIFSKENGNSGENGVLVDVVIQTEAAKVAGKDAVWDENGVVDRVLWFQSFDGVGAETSVGLSLEIVERMKWEQERVGWVAGNERQVRVERAEEFGGTNKWKNFSCYVLVESFVLKRMNRRLMLTYDYKHTHQIRSKWD